MKVETYKPLSRADLHLERPPTGANPIQEVPSYVDRVLEPAHSQLKDLTRLAQGQISFADNFNSEIREVTLRHLQGTDVSLKQLRGKPIGMLPIFWSAFDFFALFRMQILDVNRVRLWPCFLNSSGTVTDPGEPVDSKIIFLGA